MIWRKALMKVKYSLFGCLEKQLNLYPTINIEVHLFLGSCLGCLAFISH